ncbi:MAG TPA: hypothetical protein VIN04_15805 [Myxococcota bacterium]|jgi:hypothetical protein
MRKAIVAALGMSAIGLLGLAEPAGAVPVTLQDGSAVVSIDPGSQDGVSGWAVNGVTHLRTQWFWFRVGSSGPEQSIDTLTETARVVTDTDGDGQSDTLFLALADPQQRFALELRWSLTGSPFAPPTAGASSDLALQLTLFNTSNGPLDITLFQYTDLDLFNTAVDDTASWSGAGGPNTALVTDGTGLAEWESVWTPRPDAVDASVYDSVLASLLDGDPTTLSGALAAFGDVTVTAAWRALLGAGGALLLSQDQQLRVAPVDEPSLFFLIGGGLALLAARCRGRHRASSFTHPEVGQ